MAAELECGVMPSEKGLTKCRIGRRSPTGFLSA
jgi:hypothetical protein